MPAYVQHREIQSALIVCPNCLGLPMYVRDGSPMPTAKARASTILGAFEQAQTELVGKAVILTDGKAGTVENVWLDELRGLRISIGLHEGNGPVSTGEFDPRE